jgi:putative transposase
MTMHIERLFDMQINRKRIYRLMKLAGIESVIQRRRKKQVSTFFRSALVS